MVVKVCRVTKKDDIEDDFREKYWGVNVLRSRG
jgi:hypothetical protein